jgi:hypothetical protein
VTGQDAVEHDAEVVIDVGCLPDDFFHPIPELRTRWRSCATANLLTAFAAADAESPNQPWVVLMSRRSSECAMVLL